MFEDDEPLACPSIQQTESILGSSSYDVVFLFAKGIEKAIQNDCNTIPFEDISGSYFIHVPF